MHSGVCCVCTLAGVQGVSHPCPSVQIWVVVALSPAQVIAHGSRLEKGLWDQDREDGRSWEGKGQKCVQLRKAGIRLVEGTGGDQTEFPGEPKDEYGALTRPHEPLLWGD